MKMQRCLTLLTVAAFLASAQTKSSDAAFGAARHQEEAEGNYPAAIQTYKKILAQYAKDRAITAKALVRMGECYEKLGDAEARKAYEQVVKNFADQKDAAAQAAARLSAMTGTGRTGDMTTTSVWQRLESTPIFNTARNRPLLPYTDLQTGDLMLRDLVTGATRNLTNNGPERKGKQSARAAAISDDGKMLAYIWSTGPGKPEIRSINADGTGMRIHGLVENPGFKSMLSPDKKTLLVSTHIAKNGSVPAHYVLQSLSLADDTLKPFAGGFWGADASFSPDGRVVALVGTVGPGSGAGDGLFVASADGTGLRKLHEGLGKYRSPLWTADGKWIVFDVTDERQKGTLRVIPPTGGNARTLTEGPGIMALLGLTQDGSLFYSAWTRVSDVEIVRLDPITFAVLEGPGRFVETRAGSNDRPSFSPDGKWIAWNPFGVDWMRVRPTAGGDETVVPLEVGPKWFPDSQSFLHLRNDGDQKLLERVGMDGRVTRLYRGSLPSDLDAVTALPQSNEVLWVLCAPSGSEPCRLVRYDMTAKSESVESLPGIVFGFFGAHIASSPDGQWLAFYGKRVASGPESLFVRSARIGGKLIELARDDEHANMHRAKPPVFTPDSKQVLYGVWMPEVRKSEFRVIPVEGGTPKSIAVPGDYPTFHPDGRLAYNTEWNGRTEIWMVRNLTLK